MTGEFDPHYSRNSLHAALSAIIANSANRLNFGRRRVPPSPGYTVSNDTTPDRSNDVTPRPDAALRRRMNGLVTGSTWRITAHGLGRSAELLDAAETSIFHRFASGAKARRPSESSPRESGRPPESSSRPRDHGPIRVSADISARSAWTLAPSASIPPSRRWTRADDSCSISVQQSRNGLGTETTRPRRTMPAGPTDDPTRPFAPPREP